MVQKHMQLQIIQHQTWSCIILTTVLTQQVNNEVIMELTNCCGKRKHLCGCGKSRFDELLEEVLEKMNKEETIIID